MRLRPWLRHTLWGAFALSLLLHVAGMFSEEIYYLLSKPEFEQTELSKPSQTLKSMTLDEETQAELAGITPVDILQVYLHASRQAQPVPAPEPVKQAIRTPDKITASRPVPVTIATAPVPELPAVEEKMPATAPVQAIAPQPAPVVSQAEETPAGKEETAGITPAPAPDFSLARYPNELKITYVYGIIPAQMTWKISGGRYDLRLEGSFLGSSRIFLSQGKVDRRGVIPEQFIEYRNGKPEPRYQVDFDWSAMSAEVGEPGKRKIEMLATGDQDIFSTAFHVGLIGGNQAEHTFSIFSGRRKYENAVLRVAGEARLRLGQKEVTALLLRGEWDDRRADFWLAPEWHNIPVRMTFVMGSELTLDIWANEITIEGQKVLEWVRPQNRRPGERGSSNR